MPKGKKRGFGFKKNEKKRVYEIAVRYLVIFLSALGNLRIFYFIFSPLTIFPVDFILRFFYDIITIHNFIFINGIIIDISDACVAGSAYFLLFMLNLLTSEIKLMRRIKLFLFTSALLLMLNIIRIIAFAFVLVNNIPFFEQLHIFFWHFISAVYVFIVWIIAVKMFNIKSIPFYSDFLYIRKLGRS